MCRRLTREVYPNEEFIKFSRNQVFMRVFQDQDPEGARLARKFRIEGVPTILVLNSDGEEVDRILGAMDVQEYIKELTRIFKSAKDKKYTI